MKLKFIEAKQANEYLKLKSDYCVWQGNSLWLLVHFIQKIKSYGMTESTGTHLPLFAFLETLELITKVYKQDVLLHSGNTAPLLCIFRI